MDDRLEITTALEQWAYALVIPIGRTKVEEGSVVRLTLALEVDKGTLQADVLNEAETDIITTATQEVGPLRTVE